MRQNLKQQKVEEIQEEQEAVRIYKIKIYLKNQI